MTSQCETGGLTRTVQSIIYPAEGKKKLLEQAAFQHKVKVVQAYHRLSFLRKLEVGSWKSEVGRPSSAFGSTELCRCVLLLLFITMKYVSFHAFLLLSRHSLQLRVCSFALQRFQILARRSVQFSSFLFRQNIMQYKNTYRNCKGARETRRLMKPGFPILKEIISNKQKKQNEIRGVIS